MVHGAVVGVAFEGFNQLQNVGYVVPYPVIRQFLNDLTLHGRYTGIPTLGVKTLDMENPSTCTRRGNSLSSSLSSSTVFFFFLSGWGRQRKTTTAKHGPFLRSLSRFFALSVCLQLGLAFPLSVSSSFSFHSLFLPFGLHASEGMWWCGRLGTRKKKLKRRSQREDTYLQQ